MPTALPGAGWSAGRVNVTRLRPGEGSRASLDAEELWGRSGPLDHPGSSRYTQHWKQNKFSRQKPPNQYRSSFTAFLFLSPSVIVQQSQSVNPGRSIEVNHRKLPRFVNHAITVPLSLIQGRTEILIHDYYYYHFHFFHLSKLSLKRVLK